MTDLAHEAEACRRLWVAVAAAAVGDAAKNVVQAGKDRSEAVEREMRYFRSRSWREVCTLAGISYRPDHIEQMLLSPKAADSLKKMGRAYGVVGTQEGAA